MLNGHEYLPSKVWNMDETGITSVHQPGEVVASKNRHLIALDEHQSHTTLDAVNYARAHGIELITLPLHCTHKVRPLDRCFFKSLKSAYNVSADNWMTSHHGQRITFYDMAGSLALRSCESQRQTMPSMDCGPADCGPSLTPSFKTTSSLLSR